MRRMVPGMGVGGWWGRQAIFRYMILVMVVILRCVDIRMWRHKSRGTDVRNCIRMRLGYWIAKGGFKFLTSVSSSFYCLEKKRARYKIMKSVLDNRVLIYLESIQIELSTLRSGVQKCFRQWARTVALSLWSINLRMVLLFSGDLCSIFPILCKKITKLVLAIYSSWAW